MDLEKISEMFKDIELSVPKIDMDQYKNISIPDVTSLSNLPNITDMIYVPEVDYSIFTENNYLKRTCEATEETSRNTKEINNKLDILTDIKSTLYAQEIFGGSISEECKKITELLDRIESNQEIKKPEIINLFNDTFKDISKDTLKYLLMQFFILLFQK